MRAKVRSILSDWELWLKERAAKRVPGFLSSKTLTYLSLVSTILVLLAYYLSRENLAFIWLASFFIFTQWVTDTLDGAVGRYRKEGYVKWGMYVDHFFDYLFFIALTFGIYFVISQPEFLKYFIIIFAIGSAFFIHVFLYASAAGIFEISAFMISGTELRFIIILLNTAIFFLGKKILTNHWLYIAVVVILTIVLLFMFVKTQHNLSDLDMKIKNKNKRNSKRKSKSHTAR